MDKRFFSNPTESVAKDLLGCTIAMDGLKGRIVETEAYLEDDLASHAHGGRTERNRIMYEEYGYVYIYLCYGIHNMLNFTTEKDNAGAVLIRALEPLEGLEEMRDNRGVEDEKDLCNGPGKLCEAFGIDKEMNETVVGEEIRVEEGESGEVEISTRVGISEAKDRELRFYEKGNRYVSER